MRFSLLLDFIYDASGRPFALKYSADGGSTFTTYYYVLNLQGDVVKLVEQTRSGKVYTLTTVASYTYNAWGEILTATGTMAEINPLRYRGYYYDSETGFYYLQSRYYDPAMHRFINADSLTSTGQGILGTNMFAYCGNNPIRRVDATGNWFWEDWWDAACDVVEDVCDAICDAAEAVADAAVAVWDTSTEVIEAVYNNLDISVGFGQGLYFEASVFEVIDIGAGGYVNYASVQLDDGEFNVVQEKYAGATAEILQIEIIGDSTYSYREIGESDVGEWIEDDSPKDSFTLFSMKAYLLYLGFSVEFGFDFGGFFSDLKEIS